MITRACMNRRDVERSFSELYPESAFRSAAGLDLPGRREAFCVYIDGLHRDGQITDRLAQNITMPTPTRAESIRAGQTIHATAWWRVTEVRQTRSGVRVIATGAFRSDEMIAVR